MTLCFSSLYTERTILKNANAKDKNAILLSNFFFEIMLDYVRKFVKVCSNFRNFVVLMNKFVFL